MGTSSSVVVVDSRGSFSSLRLRDVMVGRRGREEVRERLIVCTFPK